MRTKQRITGFFMAVIVAVTALTVPAAAKISAPSKIKATVKSETSVTVSWDKVSGAAKYIVYYSDNSKDYTAYGATQKTSATVKKLVTGTKYYFAVKAVDKNGKKSAYSKAVTATPKAEEKQDNGSIKVITAPGRVQNGKKAYLKIQGAPNTEYSLLVHYPSKSGEAKGIGSVTSDNKGFASWEWTVGTRTTPDKHLITVIGGGKSYDLGKILETYKKNG